jgi:hypothetical protein
VVLGGAIYGLDLGVLHCRKDKVDPNVREFVIRAIL